MELIKVDSRSVGDEQIQTVNARELHGFLESKQQFADWIKARIEQYGFVDGVDFTVHKIMNGRATQIDYHISINMAKEIAMVERNEKGRQARQYFIECEKRLKEMAPEAFSIPKTYAEALQLAADQARQIEQQTALIEQQQPAVEFVERYVADGHESKCMSDVAKLIKWSPRHFIKKICEDGIIFRRDGCYIPYQKHIDEGRFKVITGERESVRYFQTRVTPKGINWLAGIYG